LGVIRIPPCDICTFHFLVFSGKEGKQAAFQKQFWIGGKSSLERQVNSKEIYERIFG
jgi:hypothetical protein